MTGNCRVTQMSMGDTVSGTLSATGCRSTIKGNAYYAAQYSFTATAGQQVSIQVTSDAFDSYIYLIGPDGRIMAQDDDSGGGTNSQIQLSIPADGTYIIEVTSFNINSLGSFTLRIE
jgi:hypothetical protein